MKRIALLIINLSLFILQPLRAQPLPPTMGWSSWNTFGLDINEEIIRGQADAMVRTGLNRAGYQYINIDDGYFYGRNETTGALRIHPERFPNGFRPLVDYIHGLGLKAGIYSDAGASTCGSWGNPDKSGRGVGLYGHDRQDLEMFFTEMDFDFIKVDFCGGNYNYDGEVLYLDPQERYETIARTIRDTRRPDAVLNVCRWAYPGTWVSQAALSWRTTGDITDTWPSVRNIVAENLYLSAYSGPGYYNDMDMLEVGRRMSEEEDRTHFGLWCMMNSPLLIGCDLRDIRPEALALLKNADLIGINQDPTFQQAYPVKKTHGCYILVRDLETLNGLTRAFAVYNPTDEAANVTVMFPDLCLGGTVRLRDCFEQRDLGTFTGGYQVVVPAHGTRIYRAEADERLERTRYEAETAYIPTYQETRNNQEAQTAIYAHDDRCSSGMKACWLGQSEENRLEWTNVYTNKGGRRTLTIAYLTGEERQMAVSVNGRKPQTISVTGSDWGRVGQVSVPIKLKKGRNTIRLSNAAGWMPDIDYIEVR